MNGNPNNFLPNSFWNSTINTSQFNKGALSIISGCSVADLGSWIPRNICKSDQFEKDFGSLNALSFPFL